MDCAAPMRGVFEFFVRLLTFFVLDIRILNREWAFLMSRSSLGFLASCSHLPRPILRRIFYAAPTCSIRTSPRVNHGPQYFSHLQK